MSSEFLSEPPNRDSLMTTWMPSITDHRYSIISPIYWCGLIEDMLGHTVMAQLSFIITRRARARCIRRHV
jgi:hypothetical protein